MSLRIGQQLGSYQIASLLGKGGMGEVYRAWDTRLKREVAIKILPDAFSNDHDRVVRFQREAELLASLNHTNIAIIHDLQEVDGFRFLIMELVGGETLADRIATGALPLDDALAIAKQICEALEAAHEKGIIHRDLKPGNVKILPDGKVKILDFGLAKVVEAGSRNISLSNSPTLSIAATDAGVILGTAAYMSPEQAKSQTVDRRTDIWSFGCVLYEMLTGQRAFQAQTVSEAIAAILAREPDWGALENDVPSGIRRVLHRCLEKDARRRLRDIGDARIEIEEALSAAQPTPGSVTVSTGESRGLPLYWYVAGAAALSALIAAIAVWNLKPGPPTTPPGSVARFTLPIPAGVRLELGFDSSMTISPDGGHLAFVGRQGATTQLYLRAVQDAETKVVRESAGAAQPFFSPDGRWLAFFSGGKLKKVPTNGGAPVIVCDAPSSRGGFWSDNGTIVFSPLARGSGILQVSADGGTAKQITTLDAAKGETSHRLPELLPGGETVLFTAYGATYQDVSIVAQSLKTGEHRVLIEGASLPHYVSTGHLLYVQPKLPGTVMAVAFDRETLKLTGTPLPVVDAVLTNRGDYAMWDVSRTGMLAYAPGGFQEEAYDLVFVDRRGNAAPVGAPPQRRYHFPRLSPDGRRMAVTVQGIQNTLWTYDLMTSAFNRLTFEGNNDWAAWTPDGRRVAYASNRAEPWRVFWKPFDGSGKEELLLARTAGDQQPYSWSPDGKMLVYQDAAPATAQDIWMLAIDGDRRPRPLLQTTASEVDARLSPDGLWLAYASDESGRYEVYVSQVAGSGGKWQISTDGGREPVWARNGRELFYRSGERMMAADVTTQPTFQPTTPRLLFQGPYATTPTISPEYDVTPDGQRFLMIQPSEKRPPTVEFNIVLNWFQELNERVPVR